MTVSIVSAVQGNDLIFGENGADPPVGDAGDDTIVGDVVSSEFFDSDDTILGRDCNDLMFGGAGNDRINGDDGEDTLVGEDGDDRMNGGSCADTLYGDLGKDVLTMTDDDEMDVFQYLDVLEGGDRIIGFVPGKDKLQLAFASLPNFSAGAAPAGFDSNSPVLYNTVSGRLSYDANGTDPGGISLIATLADAPVITYADFLFS